MGFTSNMALFELNCTNDGGPFDTRTCSSPFVFDKENNLRSWTFPTKRDVSGDFSEFSKRPFCSASCVKCYLSKNISTSHYFLELFDLWCARMGVSNVLSAPSPRTMKYRNLDGVGYTLEKYRSLNQSTEEEIIARCLPNVFTQQVVSGLDVLSVELPSDSLGLSKAAYKTHTYEREKESIKPELPPTIEIEQDEDGDEDMSF